MGFKIGGRISERAPVDARETERFRAGRDGMVSRSEAGRGVSGLLGARAPRLGSLKRAVCNWATLDAQDYVLDLSCGGGELLTRLLSRVDLHACGLCQQPERARQVRAQMEEADIIYARMDDIPWRDESFDAVLLAAQPESHQWPAIFSEAMRVLRRGGQFVFARPLAASLHRPGNRETMTRKELIRGLEATGFTHVTWHVSGVNAVVIAWKQNDRAM